MWGEGRVSKDPSLVLYLLIYRAILSWCLPRCYLQAEHASKILASTQLPMCPFFWALYTSNISQIQPFSLPPIPHHLACLSLYISCLSKWVNTPTKSFLSKNSQGSLILALRQLKAKLYGANIIPVHFQYTKPNRFHFSLISFCSHQCACLLQAPSFLVFQTTWRGLPFFGMMGNPPLPQFLLEYTGVLFKN